MEATNSVGSEKGYEYLKVNCLRNTQCVDGASHYIGLLLFVIEFN